MKTFQILLFSLMLSLLGVTSSIRAEDIDIYSDNAASAGVPNVLFVLDNAANFSAAAPSCTYLDKTAPTLNGTAGGIEQCALYNVISGLPEGAVNIGLMVYNDSKMRDYQGLNCGADGPNGGCLARPLTLMSGDGKKAFLAWIKTWKKSESDAGYNIKASGPATATTMQEAHAYYAGRQGLSKRNYTAPPAGCQKNFVIFIGNAYGASSVFGDGANASPEGELALAPFVTDAQKAIITIPSGSYGTSAFSCGNYTMGNNHGALYADEWARYMKQSDLYDKFDGIQSITTYTVGLLGPQCKPDYPALLASMAKVGGGTYFATSSYDEIATAILKILNEIQAVNSVFASASLPVSVNAQGTYLNQIFLGMFRPDASANPRWVGNLKQYQFVLVHSDPKKPDPNTATLRLGDSAGKLAINPTTGFITPGAVSFWTNNDTPDPTGGFFINDARGEGGAFDSPDGQFVEKGGAAQQLRLNSPYASTPSSPRRLYTYCPSFSGCNASLTDPVNAFATTNAAITDASLSSISSISVLSITRSDTTATVTTVGIHGYNNGDSIVISGAAQAEYNGTKALITKTSDTQFTFAVAESPPTPANGTYFASLPSAAAKNVGSITRAGNTATVTVTAHGYTTGTVVTISGAAQAEYNGSFSITNIAPDSFSYRVNETPPLQAGGGKVMKSGGATVDIAPYDATPGKTGILRALGSRTVRVSTGNAKHNLATGDTVTLSGVNDSLNVTVNRYNIGPVPIINESNSSFTFEIPALSITPASPATQAVLGTAIKAQAGGDIPISLTRIGTVATATTTVPHGFSGPPFPTVNIGGTIGTNESAYVGSFPITEIPNTTSFRYSVVTSPVSPATGTITAQKSRASDRTALINWVRGEDNFGDEASPGSGVTVRPSIHGDVLHSRPVVINFGTDAVPSVVVFYGGNDGVFRAVNGNQTGSITSSSITSGTVTVAPGGELWGLVLPEHYSKLNRQRVNSPELKLPSTPLGIAAQTKDYFVDGSPGVYQKLCGKGATTGNCVGKAEGTIDKAYLYLTMRRGGRFIYALDVSSPTDPKIMWKIDSTGTRTATSFTADAKFAELGQTWSRPRVTLVKGYPNPVLVFGAGYDSAEDAEPPNSDIMGRGIFVLDAVTGARVWSAAPPDPTVGTTGCTGSSTQAACAVTGMNWAIPADISFVDRDNNGKTDRFYAADLGGNVWRVDLEPTAGDTPDKWQVNKLAALGCSSGICAPGKTPRKFFFPPNVVPVGDITKSDSYDVVLLGSGDREHPLTNETPGSAYTVTNRFYALKDTVVGKDASGMTAITETGNLFAVNASNPVYDGTLKGFYTTFATGEKAVNASTTLRGTTFFGTNKPTPPRTDSCSANLGQARGYALNPFTGKLNFTSYVGGGLPPSPTAGIVTIALPDGSTVKKEFCLGCGGAGPGAGGSGKDGGCNSALEACTPATSVAKNPRRTYWYKK